VFVEKPLHRAITQQANETEGPSFTPTRQNLVRVRDVMDEVRVQLNFARATAKKATSRQSAQSGSATRAGASRADSPASAARAEMYGGQLVRLRGPEKEAVRTRRRPWRPARPARESLR